MATTALETFRVGYEACITLIPSMVNTPFRNLLGQLLCKASRNYVIRPDLIS